MFLAIVVAFALGITTGAAVDNQFDGKIGDTIVSSDVSDTSKTAK